MNGQSIPAVVMASIVLFMGIYNLSIFFRRTQHREYLAFSLACLVIGLFDVASAILYTASSWREGALGQRLQLIALSLLCGLVPWFLFEYFAGVVPVSRVMRSIAQGTSAFFGAAAALDLFNPFGAFWSADTPLVKTIHFSPGVTLVYNEVALGPFSFLQEIFGLAMIVFLVAHLLRLSARNHIREVLPVVAVLIVLLGTAVSDAAVAEGLLAFPYTSEYALMGFALLITLSLSRRIVGAVGVQEALAASEARFRGTFQHAAVSLWVEDISGFRALLRDLQSRGVTDLASHLRDHPETVREALQRIRVVDVNEMTMRLFGAISKEEMLGPLDLTADADALPHLQDHLLAIAEGRTGYDRESTARTLDGRRLSVLISAYIPKGTDNDDRMLVSVIDITARKKAEQKFRSFIQQSSEAIYLVEETGMIVEFNPSAEKLYGIPRTEVIGEDVRSLVERGLPADARTPELLARIDKTLSQAVRTGTGVDLNHSVKGTLERPDGSRRDFVQFIFPIRGESGYMLGCIAHDMTEARRTEEALSRSVEQLRQAQKLEAVGTLAGGIAHDFNNLLTGILGSASLLSDQLPANSPLRDDAKTIESSALRAAELVAQILTFSRQDPRVEMSPVDPNAVVTEVVRLLARTVDKSIVVETSLASGLRVMGDAGQIHQAILNLCLNACDAMPGGGTLSITTSSDPTASPSRMRVEISVADTGIGMAEDLQARIFEPFFTTKEKGRGLGLAMVYGIVHAHEGDIRVRSVPGKGTDVRISLPATGQPLAGARSGDRPLPGGTETVLVIDDELAVRRVMDRMLQRAGYAVLLAEDGPSGLAIFKERHAGIDLVVLDLSMPGMSGTEVYEALIGIDADARVILSSGYSDDDRITKILDRGVSSFLRKPYSVEKVLHAVRDALDRA